MKLKFLGRCSGFSDLKEGHTSAFFETTDNDLVVIDLPMSSFYKLKNFDLSKYNNIFVLITHTHGDHISGLGLFAQLTFFVFKKKIKIIAPSDDVRTDISTVLKIEGNDPDWYYLDTAENFKHTYCKTWFKREIKTTHSPQLENKCFGYIFNINETNVIYTGDTSTLEPFKEYLTPDSELYVDTSVHYGQIHLKLEDLFKEDLDDINVYLMHLDSIEDAQEMITEKGNFCIVNLL